MSVYCAIVNAVEADYFEVISFDDVTLRNSIRAWAQLELMPRLFSSGALLTKTGNQVITGENLTWETEEYDIGGWFDFGTSDVLIVVPSGVELIRLSTNLETGGTSFDFQADILDGAGSGQYGLPRHDQQTARSEAINMISAPIAVSAADDFKVFADSAGGSPAVQANGYSWFSVERLANNLKYALVRRSSNQDIPVSEFTIINWDVEVVDTGGWHDLVSNTSRLTVPSGIARIRLIANYKTVSTESGETILTFQKNGMDFDGMGMGDTEGGGDDAVNAASAIIDVVEGDYFEVSIRTNSASQLGSQTQSWFSIEEVTEALGYAVETNIAQIVVPDLASLSIATEINTSLVLFKGLFALIRKDGNQVIAAAAGDTILTWETEISDLQDIHSTTVNDTRFTIPEEWNGRYVRLSWNIHKTSDGALAFKTYGIKNGSGFPGAGEMVSDTQSSDEMSVYSAIVNVIEGDYFEVVSTDDATIQNVDDTWAQLELITEPFNGALVSKTSTQVITTATVLTWQTENYDLDSWFGVDDKLFTVPSGVELIRLTTNIETGGTSFELQIDIVDGAGAGQYGLPRIDVETSTFPFTEIVNATSAPIAVSATDDFKVIGDGRGGSPTANNNSFTWFSVEKLRVDLKYALVRKSINQTLTAEQWTIVDWDAEVVDTHDWHDLDIAPSRLTVPEGITRVRLVANYVTVSIESSQTILRFQKNGIDFEGMGRGDTESDGSDAANIKSALIDVVEGDYFELEIWRSTTNAEIGSETESWFSIEEVTTLHILGLATEINTALAVLKHGFFALVRQDSTQVIAPAAGDTTITWETEITDIVGIHSTVSNDTRFTIPSAWNGKYVRLSYSVQKQSSGTAGFIVYGIKSGAVFQGAPRQVSESVSADDASAYSAIVQVSTGDYFEVKSTDDVTIENDDLVWAQLELMPDTFNGALVTKSSTQVVSGATIMVWQTEEYDLDGWFNILDDDKLIVVPSGVSLIRLSTNLNTDGTADQFFLEILDGLGAGAHGLPKIDVESSFIEALNAVSAPIAVSAADDFKVSATSGGTPTVQNDGFTWFQVEKLPSNLKYALVNRSSTQQFLPSSDWTTIQWDESVVDTSGWHSTSVNNSRMTVPAGITQVRLVGNFRPQADENGQLVVRFRKNDALFEGSGRQDSSTISVDHVNAASAIIDCIDGDYFEMEIWHNGGLAHVVDNDDVWFSIEEITPSIGVAAEINSVFGLAIRIHIGVATETDTVQIVIPFLGFGRAFEQPAIEANTAFGISADIFALVRQDSNQIIAPAAGDTIITWETEISDVGNIHSSGANTRFTVPSAWNNRYVRLSFSISDDNNPNDGSYVYGTKNGAAFQGAPAQGTESLILTDDICAIGAPVQVITGDYFEIVSTDDVDLVNEDRCWAQLEVLPEPFNGALVSKNTPQSLGSSGEDITWEVEDYDLDGWFGTNTTDFTVPSGVSLIRLTAQINGDPVGRNWFLQMRTGAGGLLHGLPNLSTERFNSETSSNGVSAPMAVSASDTFKCFGASFGNNDALDNGYTWFAVEVLPSNLRYAIVKRSDEFNIVSGAWRTIPWNDEEVDIGGWHDNSVDSSRLTVIAGVSRVRLTGNFIPGSGNPGQATNLRFTKNGVEFDGMPQSDCYTIGTENQNNASAIIDVVEGDYFEYEVWSDQSNRVDTPEGIWFSIEEVERDIAIVTETDTAQVVLPFRGVFATLGLASETDTAFVVVPDQV